jgi:dihydrofolate reductase/thymidylate synthase
MFSIVIACDNNGGIGLNGKLPWTCPRDMEYFKQLTTQTTDKNKQNAVIMGRKTWESLPSRKLPNRFPVVITTRSLSNVITFTSIQHALSALGLMSNIERIFVIGGKQLYDEAIRHPKCLVVYRTRIHSTYECDTFIDTTLPGEFIETNDSKYVVHIDDVKTNDINSVEDIHSTYDVNTIKCTFEVWVRREQIVENEEEFQYLELVKRIIRQGNDRPDRTGTGVLSLFGESMRFDLRNGKFPLLTTKRVFFKGVVEELLWFLRGSTNAKLLRDKGVKIWDGNASRSYLDSIGLYEREEDDLGPVYGFQWRHFGATYKTMHDNYAGQGVDQISDLIRRIKSTPTDRRLILSAWNPIDLNKMALPPCHCFCQFYVHDGYLSCQMYQRSCDMGLGVPFNIASYALLVYIMAFVCDLNPGEFIHVLGDAHVYKNHIESLNEQCKREPRSFPTLEIKAPSKDVNSITADHIILSNYNPYGQIKMTMSV